MSVWTRGYYAEQGYTFGSYREMYPDWLDTGTILSGCIAPSEWNAAPRYLELGCGQGFGLCMAAACYPHIEFVGVDFMPAHISHGKQLARKAGLANVTFIEADLLEMAATASEMGPFDYITMHGLFTWVQEDVRRAIITILDRALAPGGLAYLSYNSLPGWLPTVPFQHVVSAFSRQFPQSGADVINAGIRLFEQLEDGKAAMFGAMPAITTRLKSLKDLSPTYLQQEYLNGGWQPLWASDVARLLGDAKLEYVGSASIPENFLPGMLPEKLRNLANATADAALRRDIVDCCIMQSFRSDIFMRGRSPRLSGAESVESLMATRIADSRDPSVKIPAVYADFDLPESTYRPVFDMLNDGPRSVGDLLAAPGFADQPHSARLQAVLLLTSGGLLSLRRARAHDAGPAKALNRLIAREVAIGNAYRHLACPASGLAAATEDVDMLALHAYSERPEGDVPAHAALIADHIDRLTAGTPEATPREKTDKIAHDAAERLKSFLLPEWRRLDMVD